jgi:hypothetical protein
VMPWWIFAGTTVPVCDLVLQQCAVMRRQAIDPVARSCDPATDPGRICPLVALRIGVDARAQSGSRDALPLINNPSEPCVRVNPAHGSSKPRGRCRPKLVFRFPALAGLQPAQAGCVH